MTTPYTYLVGWSNYDLWYYGVRFAKGCNPNDLWVTYFTSSNRVKHTREQYGEPDVVEIRRVFKNQDSARVWEHKVLKRMKVIKNSKWLNQTDNVSIGMDVQTRIKISNTKKGRPNSESHNRKIGDFHRGKIESAETRLKKSLSRTGKTHSDETLRKLSENSGRAKPVEVNGVMYRSLKHAAQTLFPDSPDIRKVKRLLAT